MYQNNGTDTNENVFWNEFCRIFGEGARADEPHFAAFYETEFDRARDACGFDKAAAPTVAAVLARGLRVCIATNPLFPEIATRKRLSWAGVDPAAVEFYTTYENCRYCKPSKGYFSDVAARLGISPAECLMVGNDADEDMAAQEAGMQVFLLVNEHLLNRSGKDINAYPRGNFKDLLAFIDQHL
jgi:FMN phosphatase YigB (HAD superfamily)